MQYKTKKEHDFDMVYETYKSEVYRIALYFTRRPHSAEEITQIVFYQLYLHFDHIRLETVRAYLVRTTKNVTYNWQRDGGHQRHMENMDWLDIVLPQEFSAEEHFLRQVQIVEAEKLSEDILTKLQEKNQSWYEVIVMAYLMEKSQEDVAKELGISMDVLYSRLYRAKQWIRKHYTERYEDVYKYS